MTAISIIGLGYVGLPLTLLCSEKGLNVYGIDNDINKIEFLKKGTSHIEDKSIIEKLNRLHKKIIFTSKTEEAVKNSSIVIICVPTPVDHNNIPNLDSLKKASESVSKTIQKGTLIVIESTIFPGTTEEIVLPILKKSGLKEKEFFLAHCPERIDPGNKQYDISNLPRVIGGIDEESLKLAYEFYSHLIDAPITLLSSVKAAEATKIMENTFRDINIAFVNEMAKSFDKAGIDITEVIKGASTKPFAFMPHFPGVGVGGHCIPVDPYYLIEKAKQIGFHHEFLKLARKINESMPYYTINLLEDELKKINKNVEEAKIGILGVAYKADVDDVRESPAIKVIEILKNKNSDLYIYDPFLKNMSNVSDLDETLKKSDYIILTTDHNEFKNMDLNKLKEHNIKIVIDGKNCLDKEKIKNLGIKYHGIGCS